MEDAADPIDVVAVEDHIQSERPAQLLDQTSCRDLASIGRSAGYTVREGWLVGLDADLYVVEAGGRREVLIDTDGGDFDQDIDVDSNVASGDGAVAADDITAALAVLLGVAVGSGAVMTGHWTPLSIVEQFVNRELRSVRPGVCETLMQFTTAAVMRRRSVPVGDDDWAVLRRLGELAGRADGERLVLPLQVPGRQVGVGRAGIDEVFDIGAERPGGERAAIAATAAPAPPGSHPRRRLPDRRGATRRRRRFFGRLLDAQR